MIIKICTKCKEKLPASIEYFNKHKNGKYGFRSTCKECNKIYIKQLSSTDEYKKKHRERAARYRANNPIKTLEINRKSYKKHREKNNKIRREKYINDPKYRQKCIELEKIYKESGRRYEMNNKPVSREKARIRSAKRRLDPEKKEWDYKANAAWRIKNKDKIKKNRIKKKKKITPQLCCTEHENKCENINT